MDRVSSESLSIFLRTNTIRKDESRVTTLPDSVKIEYDDGNFNIKFGRMPFLVSLFDFLASMEGCAFYQDLEKIIEELTARGNCRTLRLVKNATN